MAVAVWQGAGGFVAALGQIYDRFSATFRPLGSSRIPLCQSPHVETAHHKTLGHLATMTEINTLMQYASLSKM
jgi:hypothetical protein